MHNSLWHSAISWLYSSSCLFNHHVLSRILLILLLLCLLYKLYYSSFLLSTLRSLIIMATRMDPRKRKQEWRRRWGSRIRQGPAEERRRLQLVCRRRHHLHESTKRKTMKIEAKTFNLKKKKCPNGCFLEIVECGSHLSGAVIIPQPAIFWLRKALKDAIWLQQVARPGWNNKFGRYNLELQVISNLRGRL